MLLFRSEEHVASWTGRRSGAAGAFLTPHQGWHLARAWYHDRLSKSWRRKTPEEAQAVFEEIGLVDPFWRLTGDVSSTSPTDTPKA